MNIELRNKVIERILEHPEELNMSRWIDHFGCCTTACFAGWTVIVGDGFQDANRAFSEGTIGKRAVELLGITAQEAKSLFNTNEWPRSIWEEYQIASQKEKAEIVAERAREIIHE